MVACLVNYSSRVSSKKKKSSRGRVTCPLSKSPVVQVEPFLVTELLNHSHKTSDELLI